MQGEKLFFIRSFLVISKAMKLTSSSVRVGSSSRDLYDNELNLWENKYKPKEGEMKSIIQPFFCICFDTSIYKMSSSDF